jgi:DNA-binding response OmpR family regulator
LAWSVHNKVFSTLMPHQKILIIDDEAASIGLLLAYLGDRAGQIMVALDGPDGIAKALAGQPDLILLDLKLPGIDGFAICQQLKADMRTAHIPVIFLTASALLQDKLKGFALGAVDYITKPFIEDEVIARVGVQLALRQQLNRLEALGTSHALARFAPPADRDQVLLQQAIDFLGAEMADPPSLAELARRVGSNGRKLTDLFRHHLGMTVFDYLDDLRLETARRLLESSGLAIGRVAEQIGYRNPGDFTRAFRRRYQVTPREYRQSCGQQDAVNDV